jgi:hypothetical protein
MVIFWIFYSKENSMNLFKYFIILLAFASQQALAAGKIIFRNNSGVDITINHTTLADRGQFHDARALKAGTATEYRSDNFLGTGMEAPYNISQMRATYTGTFAGAYEINVSRIKEAARNCANGDVFVEIHPKNEAPITINCR